MKIAIASDIHLEFGPLEIKNTKKADVLILSGDICVAKKLYDAPKHWNKFFDVCSKEFKQVFYVMGNHEHYHSDFTQTYKTIKEYLGQYPNIQLLEKQHVLYEGIHFIGGTLWTDMNKEDPLTLFNIKNCMSDFRVIKNNGYRFLPETTVIEHKDTLKFIDEIIKEVGTKQKYVFIGHHAPSDLSRHERYSNENLMSGAFISNLGDFIMNRPCIKLWTHGHTHDPFDYKIGKTRVVCNPRGYFGHEEQANLFKLKYVTVK